ncbi:potassium channel protein, putative [Brugia malayi]|uniref:BMA-SHK-1, isoform d n=1 Tax=Brugia malayi TaxID=6279 RepID=A0A0J9XM20_BRUMA|nr:potassium channel protein, putative [Brugia malayi]CDP90792.1 BMA-SHK-1, isoform d [Brugia malayi]VIO93509.1 potassium channel protein, putative [Brugia malayi]
MPAVAVREGSNYGLFSRRPSTKRQIEHLLNVHPEKYRSRSGRSTRTSTPINLHDIDCHRSRSVDFLSPIMDTPSNREPNNIMFNDTSSAKQLERNLITINVSGLRFQTYESTLERYPLTLLGNSFKRNRFWDPKNEEYFFDRHRTSFESILYAYQSGGIMKRPESVPIDMFVKELKFFEMGEELLEKFWISEGYEKPKEIQMPQNVLQRQLWELVEYPDSSLFARIFALLSIFVISISIISFCLETLPSMKENPGDVRDWSNPFFYIELFCIIWFTIELLLRFISCPNKFSFLRSVLNIIDFVAIAPFFGNLMWMDSTKSSSSMSFAVLRVLRLVRVFRIFKLSRHSVGLQILGKTFRASIQEFCLLIFFMVIALVLFSSGVYFAEQNEPNTKFTSIPASFWYGDLTPTGVYGKLVGGLCALIGVLTLALPVPIIVANFKHFYRQETRLAQMRASAEEDETNSEHSSKSP